MSSCSAFCLLLLTNLSVMIVIIIIIIIIIIIQFICIAPESIVLLSGTLINVQIVAKIG